MLRKWMLVFFTGLLLAIPAMAQQAFTEGVDYLRIDPAVKTSNPDKIVVTEIFWYGCPHCFRFEPVVEKWVETIPNGVIFEQIPSVLNPPWIIHARTYYALQMMGIQEQLHAKLFDAIHVKRMRLNSLDTIAEFVAAEGYDAKEFRQQYASFPVDTLVRKVKQKESHYGHRGVPTMIVNGKYMTSGSLAGNFDRLIKIINFLVAKEQNGLAVSG